MSGPAPQSVGFRRAALHLGGLWALAFAQPLFDLLGRNAQFFVARGSTEGDILLLAFGYALVPPLVGAAAVWALGRVRPALGRAALLVLIAVLAAVLVLPPLGDALGGASVAIGVALLAGAGAAALYARVAAVRAFLTVLSPAPLVVVLLFLLVSPVRELLWSDEERSAVAGPARSAVPIVHVVLDELPQSTLVDAGGRVDATLFPNLARLARRATFYRRATTVDDLTTEAVPSQLTGERPRAGQLPTAGQHPRSLFTLFARSHEPIVVEPITDVCPERLCSEARPGMADRLAALKADLELVVQHLLLPEDLRERLPAVDQLWEGFASGAEEAGALRGGANLKRDVLDRLARDDATAGFESVIAALARERTRPPLLFLHSTLPHASWRFLPDGRRYPLRPEPNPGLSSKGWTGPQWQVDQAFGRHVLQVQYTDRLVGELLDALRAADLFDAAVIVVAADHGVAFRSGQPRRPANAVNMTDIAGVPLFVKWPEQREGRVDDRAVRTVDVLPTIAKAVGVQVPWRTDGVPADERSADADVPIEVSHAGAPATTMSLDALLRARRAREALEADLLRGGPYAIGPEPQLIGRPVDADAGPEPGGPRATIDAAAGYRAVDAGSAVVPALVSGTVQGVEPEAALAVALNGRVVATTRAFRYDDGLAYAVVVPPSALHDGANRLAVLQVLPGGALRPLAVAG